MKTLIIAEAGVNHNGDMGLARNLVREAACAGADFVKFQTFDTDANIARSAPKAEYQRNVTGDSESHYEMVKRLELTHQDHRDLVKECDAQGIRFFSTGFDIGSIDFLCTLGLDRIKIPSGEITNLPLLKHIAQKKLPIILSTGMSTLGEIEATLGILLEGGVSRSEITVLHCNTEYPTPMADVNLKTMLSLGTAFNVKIGYSDHTLGIEIPVAAVTLGACVIEKHFTLDKRLPGPDHQASLEPDEFAAMVTAIRNVELAMSGDGIKRPSASEEKNRNVARKSIVANQPIRQGELLGPHNLAVKRPGTGISAMQWDDVVGRLAIRDFAFDEAVEI